MRKPPAKKNPSPGRRNSHRVMGFCVKCSFADCIHRITGPGRWLGKASHSGSLMVGLVGSLWAVRKATTKLKADGV